MWHIGRAFVVSLCILGMGCVQATKQVDAVSGRESPAQGGKWESLLARGLEGEWNRGHGRAEIDLMRGILRFDCVHSRLTLREVVDLFEEEVPSEMREWASVLRDATLIELDRQGDRDSLVRLLSLSCPEYSLLLWPIEHWCATSTTVGSPIVMLMDAYDASVRPSVKKAIVEALRRGFAPLGVSERSDAGYVKACRAWYKANRGTVELNPDYVIGPPDAIDSRTGRMVRPERGLFRWKVSEATSRKGDAK